MIDNYPPVLRAFFRMVGQRWLEKIEAELWKYSQALNNWLYDLFLHPTADWRERLAAFEAEQESEGRTLTPESRTALVDYLEDWARGAFSRFKDGEMLPHNEVEVHAGIGAISPLRDIDKTNHAVHERNAGRQQVVARLASTTTPTGHHWAPKAVIFDPEIYPMLTDEARDYALGAYSGRTDPDHRYGTYGGVTHGEYNDAVKKELKQFIQDRRISKSSQMTASQMEEFVGLMNRGLDAAGKSHPQISAFNEAIKKMVRIGAKPPTEFEDIVRAGRKLASNSRYRLIVSGAILSGLLGEVVAQQVKTLDIVSHSDYYRLALQALQNGDLPLAHALLTGMDESLYMEVLSKAGAFV